MENKKIGMVQIGVGNWGKNLLRNFYNHPQVDLKTVCDVNEETLARVKRDYPDVEVTSRFDDVFKADNFDAAVVATQADMHYEISKRLLETGKHVFVEKPMTLDLDHSKELVELSKKNDKILMVGHILEYHPAFVKVKEMIDAGELGDIYYIYTSRVNLGIVRQNENSLWSFAPHDISIILMLIGMEPTRVISTGKSFLQKDIEDVVFTTLHFGDKKMAHMHVSWLDPHKIRKVTVVGSKKMVVVDDMESAEKIRIYDKGVNFTGHYSHYGEYLSLRIGGIEIPYIKNQEPLKLECQKFVDAVNTNVPPSSDGEDGLRVVRVLTAAQESLKKGGVPIEINQK